MSVNVPQRAREEAAGRLDVVERRLAGLRRAEAEAVADYRRRAARYFERGAEREVAEAEIRLARARREVARAEAAAEHWRAALL